MTKRALVLVALALFMAGALFTGCTQEPPVDEPVDADVQEITLRVDKDPETLDPAHLSWVAAHAVANNIYNGLVKWETGTFDIVPDLAYDWDISADGKTYTFYLHEGVQWHRGYGEFTAHDVKFSFDRVMDPDTESRWIGMFELIDEVEVVDDYTVSIHVSTPSPAFMHEISAYRPGKLISKAAYEDLGEDYGFNPVGTGPFMFDSWARNDQVVLVANDDYFEGPPTLRRAVFKLVPDETVATMAFEAGEVDTMKVVTGDMYQRWDADPGIALDVLPATGARYLGLKTVMEPLSDVRVRRALAHATNTQAIIDIFLQGLGSPLRSILPEGMFGYCPDTPYYEYDPERARELLTEAGYPDGIEIEAYQRDREDWRDIFAIIQSDWAKAGITMNIRVVDSAAWSAARVAGDPPVGALSLGARYDPDAILSFFMHGSVASPHGVNFSWYGGADDLIDEARVEMDLERRAELYREVQLKFYEDIPWIPLWQTVQVRALQPWVKGFVQCQAEGTVLYPVYIEGR